MKRLGLIYLCKNKINGKFYVGQTIQALENRKYRHINDALSNSDNFIFHRALKKYGIENFEWIILESNIKEKELNEKEIFYINKYKSQDRKYGYNMTPGGEEKPCGHYILTYSQVLEIINLLKNTNKTFKEIGEIYKVSLYAISDINNGKSWSQDKFDYPIREKKDSKKQSSKNKYKGSLSEEVIKSIIVDLKDTYLTNTDIAKKYNVNKLSIASINNGRNLIAREMNLDFPIRKEKIDINNKILKNKEKIFADIINPNIIFEDIKKKYKISHSTLTQINEGKILFNSNVKYPLREKTISLKMNKSLTIDNVNDIYEILEKTTISFEKIAKFFNVTKPCIRSINNGGTWSFIKKDQTFPIRKHNNDIV